VIDNRRIATIGRQYFVAAVIAFVVFSACGGSDCRFTYFKSQGSFFGVAERFPRMRYGDFQWFLNTETNTGSITVDQMYVQYRSPRRR